MSAVGTQPQLTCQVLDLAGSSGGWLIGRQRQDHLVHAGQPALPLADQLRLEGAGGVSALRSTSPESGTAGRATQYQHVRCG